MQDCFVLVLEYVNGPTLQSVLDKHIILPQDRTRFLLQQIVTAVKYLHDQVNWDINYSACDLQTYARKPRQNCSNWIKQ